MKENKYGQFFCNTTGAGQVRREIPIFGTQSRRKVPNGTKTGEGESHFKGVYSQSDGFGQSEVATCGNSRVRDAKSSVDKAGNMDRLWEGRMG